MEDPILETGVGSYTLSWPVAKLCVRIERLRERQGSLLGELVVESTHPSAPGHWGLDHFSLANAKSRAAFAKLLKQREGAEDLPWDEVLETACVRVLAAHRLGEPLIDLSTMPRLGPPGFLLSPFLLNDDIAMIFGDGDSGKSLFALYLGFLCAVGGRDPRTHLAADRPVNVLYLDFERTKAEAARRLQQLTRGFDPESTAPTLFYRRCPRRLIDDVDAIHALVKTHEIGLLIVDSVGAACGGEIQYAEPVFSYFSALRFLHLSTLHVHHINRQDRKEEKARTPYGSIYLRNYSTSTWEFRRVEEEEGTLLVGLFHDKHNTTKRIESRAYRITFDDAAERIAVEAIQMNSIPQFHTRIGLADKITHTLTRLGPQTTKSLAERLDVNEGDIRVCLKREQAREEGPRFHRPDSPQRSLIALLDEDESSEQPVDA